MQAEQEPRGRLWDATWEDYLGERDRWSNSTLKLVAELGVRYAWLCQIGKIKHKTTDAKTVGSVAHTAVWEGANVFAARYLQVARRTDASKKKAAEQGKEAINATQYGLAMAAAEAVVRAAEERAADDPPDTFLRDLLAAPGLREQSFVWEDEETGLPLKGRFDKVIPRRHIIADLTVTQADWGPDWDGWLRTARKIGKHRQAWMYKDGYQAVYGVWPRRVEIVVHVPKSNPTKDTCRVGLFEFDDEYHLELGRDESRRAMRRVLECMETGRWYDEAERGVVRMSAFPHYVYQDEEMAG